MAEVRVANVPLVDEAKAIATGAELLADIKTTTSIDFYHATGAAELVSAL